MTSRSVFLIAFLWWLVGAAAIGATYPLIITVTDVLFMTGTSDQFGPELWRVIVDAAVFGMIYGVVAALINGGLSALLQRRPQPLETTTQAVAGLWTIVAVWFMPEASDHLIERAGVTAFMALLTWALAPSLFSRYKGMLPYEEHNFLEPQAPMFRPVHMLTSSAHSSDVEAFVRSSLRTHGRGNALFTLESASAADAPATTEVFVDSGGTGHALNLAVKRWEDELASGAEDLPGFTLTDDRTLAIAPAGLSASAVVSEGIALVQSVSGAETVKVQFDGFGH